MAKVNGIIAGKFQGKFGDEIVFREWEGKTIAAKPPKERTGEPTVAQKALMKKFYLASRYAKSIVERTDQSMAQAYARARRPRQNVYSRAVEDFMTDPTVDSIDTSLYRGQPGDPIRVVAFDDFRISSVRVEIRNAAGTLLEANEAFPMEGGLYWDYTSTSAGISVLTGIKIRAIATDAPGNKGSLEVTLA